MAQGSTTLSRNRDGLFDAQERADEPDLLGERGDVRKQHLAQGDDRRRQAAAGISQSLGETPDVKGSVRCASPSSRPVARLPPSVSGGPRSAAITCGTINSALGPGLSVGTTRCKSATKLDITVPRFLHNGGRLKLE